MQAGRRVAHVFRNIRKGETVVDFLKQLQTVLYAGMVVGRNAVRHVIIVLIEAAVLSVEVYPIDCPRIFVVSPERIRSVRGQDDVLVFLQKVFFSVYLIPPFSIGTIYQHGVVTSLILLDIVVFYLWKIAYFPQVKIADKGIFAVFFQQVFRKRDEAFSLETFFDLCHNCKNNNKVQAF